MSKVRKNFLSQPAKGYPKWSGIKLVSFDLGVKHDDYLYGGYRYVTLGEQRIAQMLTEQGIAFTPDIEFPMHKRDSRGRWKRYAFIPDFIFNRDVYVWTDNDGEEFVIHGIEAKSSQKMPRKVQLLFDRRNIRVLVLCDKEINKYFHGDGIPLRLLRRYRRRR